MYDNKTGFQSPEITVFVNKREKGDYIVRIMDNDTEDFLECGMIFKDLETANAYALKCITY